MNLGWVIKNHQHKLMIPQDPLGSFIISKITTRRLRKANVSDGFKVQLLLDGSMDMDHSRWISCMEMMGPLLQDIKSLPINAASCLNQIIIYLDISKRPY